MWPFTRRSATAGMDRPPQRVEAPREDTAELRLIEEVVSWLAKHAPGVEVRPVADKAELYLGSPPKGTRGVAGAVIKFKRAKIAGIDIYDPALRDRMNDMVAHFDRLQKWSFNGVVSTKYDQGAVDGTT